MARALMRVSALQRSQARSKRDGFVAFYLALASCRRSREYAQDRSRRIARFRKNSAFTGPFLQFADSLGLGAAFVTPTQAVTRTCAKALLPCSDGYVSGCSITSGTTTDSTGSETSQNSEEFFNSLVPKDYLGAGARHGDDYAGTLVEFMVLCAAADAEAVASAVRFRGRNITGGMRITRSHYERLINLEPRLFKSQFRMLRAAFEELLALCEPHSQRRRNTPGRKPLPFRYRFAFTLNLLGVGVASLRKEAILAGCDYTSIAYSWVPGVSDIISNALPVSGTPRKSDLLAWNDMCDKFSALLLRQVRGGTEAKEEWRRRCSVWWGGMGGICLAVDGTLTSLSGMPRHVPRAQAEAYRHHKNSWCMSNLFLVDAEGVVVDGNVGVPGRAADETMLQKMSFFKGMQSNEMAESGQWGLPPGKKLVADSGLSQRA